MWNSCSEHHVVEGIGPHKGPSEYILAHLGDGVKRETKLFPRLPKFQRRRHSPPQSPAISYPTSRSPSHSHLSPAYPSPVAHPATTQPHARVRLSPTCPSSRPQTKLTHPQQSVHTPGSNTAPTSSCLQLSTPTPHLYQLQIQPCLKLIKPQQLLAAADLYVQLSPIPALPSFSLMGNHPPAARSGPAHRLDEVQTRINTPETHPRQAV